MHTMENNNLFIVLIQLFHGTSFTLSLTDLTISAVRKMHPLLHYYQNSSEIFYTILHYYIIYLHFSCVLKIYVIHQGLQFFIYYTNSLIFKRSAFLIKIPYAIRTLINFPQESQNTGAWQECLFRNQTISSAGL